MALIVPILASALLGLIALLLAIALPIAIQDEEAREIAKARSVPPPEANLRREKVLRDIRAAKWHSAGLVFACMAIAIYLTFRSGWNGTTVALLVFSAAILSLGLADWRTHLLPDLITLPFIWLGLLVQLVPDIQTVGIENSVLGAVVGYLVPWLIALYRAFAKQENAIGGGDLKMIAMIGAWLGPLAVLSTLFAGSLAVVLLHVLQRLASKSTPTREAAFGPWLAAATIGWVIYSF